MFCFNLIKVCVDDGEAEVKEVLTQSSALCDLNSIDLRRKPRCVQLTCPDLSTEPHLTNMVESALGKSSFNFKCESCCCKLITTIFYDIV